MKCSGTPIYCQDTIGTSEIFYTENFWVGKAGVLYREVPLVSFKRGVPLLYNLCRE